MKHIIWFILLIVLFTISHKSYSQDDRWKYLDKDDIYEYNYDSKSIIYTSETVSVWIKAKHINLNRVNGKIIRHTLYKFTLFCSNSQYCNRVYSNVFDDGSKISDNLECQLNYIKSEQWTETLFNILCK